MSEKYEKFSGDMSRNEVEMDLSKFMDLIQENANLKSEVAELKASDLTNPWQKWIHLARAIDAWRIWPRAFLTVYIVLVYYSAMWFMGLEEPNIEQSGLISILVGAGAAWFGLYVNSAAKEHDTNSKK
tara:strand:+ start:2027 stop:2410 length:384 start_codon:yes stop_codon:yes gene_type:complete